MTKEIWQGTLLPVFLILIAIIAIHYLNGRPLICTCGTIKFFNSHVNIDDSQHLTDWYTFSHVIHGFIFYWLTGLLAKKLPKRYRLIIALLLESGWELLENSPITIKHYQESTVSGTYQGDSIINSLSDISFMMFGFYLGSKLPTWVIVIFALFLEVLAAYVIHDNLFLNALMFIYPSQAVINWQRSL